MWGEVGPSDPHATTRCWQTCVIAATSSSRAATHAKPLIVNWPALEDFVRTYNGPRNDPPDKAARHTEGDQGEHRTRPPRGMTTIALRPLLAGLEIHAVGGVLSNRVRLIA